MVAITYIYEQALEIADIKEDSDQSGLNWTLQHNAGCAKAVFRIITSF